MFLAYNGVRVDFSGKPATRSEIANKIESRQKKIKELFGETVVIKLSDKYYRKVQTHEGKWIPDIPPTRDVLTKTKFLGADGFEEWAVYDNIEEKVKGIFTYLPKRKVISGAGLKLHWKDELLYYIIYCSGVCEEIVELFEANKPVQNQSKGEKYLKITNPKRIAKEKVLAEWEMKRAERFIWAEETTDKQLRDVAAYLYMPNVMAKEGLSYIISRFELIDWLDSYIKKDKKNLSQFLVMTGMNDPIVRDVRVKIAEAITKKYIKRIHGTVMDSGWHWDELSKQSGKICKLPPLEMSVEAAKDALEEYLLTDRDGLAKDFISNINSL